MEGNEDRRKRIRRLKKIILGTIAAAIIIPVISSVCLLVRVIDLNRKVQELESRIEELSQESAVDEVTGIYTTASVEESPREALGAEALVEEVQIQENEDPKKQEDIKKIYLTFDDGPSSNTDKILDVLKQYDVKATFFVVGKTDENSIRAYQRIVAEGHTLAMHSYSHKYSEIYASKESFIQDLTMLQEYLYQVTGVWPRYYRFPGGSSNAVSKADMQELIGYLNQVGITYFDWNVESGDAVNGWLSSEMIANNCLEKLEVLDECMILLHDAAEKDTTVEALSKVIETIQERDDAVFLPITEETVPVQHVTGNNISE